MNILVKDEADYKHQHRQLAERHGGAHCIPLSESLVLHEHLRAMYVIRSAHERGITNIAKELREFDIMISVIEQILGEAPTIDRRVKRADKHRSLEKWCLDRTGQTFKVDEIADGADVSSQKVRTFIDSRPDLFSRSGRGQYQIRDVHAERSAAKNKDKE